MRLARQYSTDRVVYHVLWFCHEFNAEVFNTRPSEVEEISHEATVHGEIV